MAGWPITEQDLAPHYEAVASRIGISGGADDCSPITAIAARCSRRRYGRQRPHADDPLRGASRRDEPGWTVHGQPAAGRADEKTSTAVARRGTSRWTSTRYRPQRLPAWITVEKMRALPNFAYERPWLALSFREMAGGQRVEVTAEQARTGETMVFRGRRLVLGAGAMGTARIVLRSFVGTTVACDPVQRPCLRSVSEPLDDRQADVGAAP